MPFFITYYLAYSHNCDELYHILTLTMSSIVKLLGDLGSHGMHITVVGHGDASMAN